MTIFLYPQSFDNLDEHNYELNVDGAFQPNSQRGGVGVVRDENGICIAAFARSFSPVLSALHMEAEACRAGLLIAVHQGWSDIELESDCSLVIAALASSNKDYSSVQKKKRITRTLVA